MKLQEIKNVVALSGNEIDNLLKKLIKAIVSNRISELKQKMEETSDKNQLKVMTQKIKILQKADDQDFYLNIEKAAVNNLNRKLEEVCENISIDLINAEYFNFTGRLK